MEYTTEAKDNIIAEEVSALKKFVYFILGSIFLAIGIIGILLPILPTTPFIMLAGYFYLRSSRRAYEWVRSKKTFRRAFDNPGLRLRSKVLILTWVWIVLLTTAYFTPIFWAKLGLFLLGITAVFYFYKFIPTI